MSGLTIDQLLTNPEVAQAMEKAYGADLIKEIRAQNVNVKTTINQLSTKSKADLLKAMNYLSALLCNEVVLEKNYLEQVETDAFLSQLGLLGEVDQIKVMKKIMASDMFKLRKSKPAGNSNSQEPPF